MDEKTRIESLTEKIKELENSVTDKTELEALKDELCDLKSIIKKEKNFYEGETRITSIRVTTDLVNLLKLRKIGNETYEQTIIRLDEETHDYEMKLRKITALVKHEGDYENTVKAIRRVLESKYVDTFIGLKTQEEDVEVRKQNSKHIDYEKVEKKYDPELTDSQNASKIGISTYLFTAWRNARGYPARGHRKQKFK